MQIDAGVAAPIRACGGPVGTVIEVRHLFHNTPVRRTYLKSDSTEAGHVIEMFTRIALAHPTVHLTYRSGGKVLHDLPAVTGIKDRIGVFFGRELADSLLWVEVRFDQTHLWGYVGHPSQSRSSTKGQFMFLSGRYVRDRSLGHALSEGFRGLLMVGRSPVAFLHLDVPPEEVDVNVHPTKVEVRFRDGQRIYSQLLATLRQTFLASDLHSKLQVPRDAEPAADVARLDPPPFAMEARPERPAAGRRLVPPAGTAQSFQSFPRPGYAGGPSDRDWTGGLGFVRERTGRSAALRPSTGRWRPTPTSTSSPRPGSIAPAPAATRAAAPAARLHRRTPTRAPARSTSATCR